MFTYDMKGGILIFMVFKTNKKQGELKYKRKSILIIIVSLFVLLWCVRDCYEIVMPIYEKIIYLLVITILVFVVLSRIINTWLNIIVSRKFVIFWDRSFGIKFINRDNITAVDIGEIIPNRKKQIFLLGYKENGVPDVIINKSDGSLVVVRCQTPEKLHQKLTTISKTGDGTVSHSEKP